MCPEYLHGKGKQTWKQEKYAGTFRSLRSGISEAILEIRLADKGLRKDREKPHVDTLKEIKP